MDWALVVYDDTDGILSEMLRDILVRDTIMK